MAKQLWIKPFTAETGIEVEYVIGPDLARVKAQVDSKNILWDVVDNFAYPAAKQGLAEPLDFEIIDPTRFISKPHPFACPVGSIFGGIAFDPNRTGAPAKDFSQFWNVGRFPGRRGLRNRVTEMLEVALLADGVASADLYPLDVERGFKSLDRIKPSIKNFFAETAQGTALIQRNEVDYTYTYANRVMAAKNAGVSIELSREQCINTVSSFFVTRGTPRKEGAMRFLEFITRPQQQAAAINHDGTMGLPIIKGVESLLKSPEQVWRPDPTSNKHLQYSDEYWAENFIVLDKRYKEWILS